MSDRLDPRDLFRGQWKALTLRAGAATRADLVGRVLVYLVPLAAGLVAGLSGFAIKSPDAILAGLALLVGGLLAVFAQIAGWRERLTERSRPFGETEESDRESLDEAVTHVLVASFWSVAGLIAVVAGQSTTNEVDGSLTGLSCGIVVAIGLHIAMLFMLVIFKLYDSYLYINRVSDRLSGSVRD
ncbi:hypothetical protein ENKNEFLB_03608 [Nocardioides aquaticus]|uniref:DUF2975 domain-containing protein n=1 Tax=Nocardioides aquaticus TaxID=160826 RepID=A0ABX8EMZ8_9ACTN|nr:hypothetical protein [Nocardioides aquaticus]QVT81200.1 hypothetical protein ENKNEFLB_03608 [Nocardioides aquaticus]